ncbi:hypothetical protein CONPUDRAFT_75260 [Coniophora puteana RWD-64-598 SS2]|uniref:Uncharacterized protein n=1 Tax=Coniophora puteana (strain RWD-64-598) TaxID=741705 RepID=A0A5M3MHW3_CONPW|nr:uncharacterized protein CONPUDRAFT_75260 [Coniophora puteana RWD-64-598 SS2]EIW78637.1 hypothetical protein CONPUDRAFT_75260 [Coniophora puteana RWD-64-598 SS2]
MRPLTERLEARFEPRVAEFGTHCPPVKLSPGKVTAPDSNLTALIPVLDPRANLKLATSSGARRDPSGFRGAWSSDGSAWTRSGRAPPKKKGFQYLGGGRADVDGSEDSERDDVDIDGFDDASFDLCRLCDFRSIISTSTKELDQTDGWRFTPGWYAVRRRARFENAERSRVIVGAWVGTYVYSESTDRDPTRAADSRWHGRCIDPLAMEKKHYMIRVFPFRRRYVFWTNSEPSREQRRGARCIVDARHYRVNVVNVVKASKLPRTRESEKNLKDRLRLACYGCLRSRDATRMRMRAESSDRGTGMKVSWHKQAPSAEWWKEVGMVIPKGNLTLEKERQRSE